MDAGSQAVLGKAAAGGGGPTNLGSRTARWGLDTAPIQVGRLADALFERVNILLRRERQSATTQNTTVTKRVDESVLTEVVHHLVERIGDQRAEANVIVGDPAGHAGIPACIGSDERLSRRVVAAIDVDPPPRVVVADRRAGDMQVPGLETHLLPERVSDVPPRPMELD